MEPIVSDSLKVLSATALALGFVIAPIAYA